MRKFISYVVTVIIGLLIGVGAVVGAMYLFPNNSVVKTISEKNVNITAIKAGKVIAAKSSGYNKGLGHVVVVEHEDGTCAIYGYCSDILVKAGDTVQAGDALAISGKTGLAGGDDDSLALVLIDDKDGLKDWIGSGFLGG